MKAERTRLVQDGILLFLLNMAASLLNYLFQVLLAGVLSVESFGTANTIFSFMLITGVPGAALTMIAARYCADPGNADGRKGHFVRRATADVSMLSVIFFAVFLAAGVPLSKILLINDQAVLLLAFILSAFGFYQPLYAGVLSGSGRFVTTGMYSMCIPAYKTAALAAAWMTGSDRHRLHLILVFMAAGTVLTAVIGYRQACMAAGEFCQAGHAKPGYWAGKEDLSILVLNACLMVYMNADLLTVRSFAPPKESGLYSAVLLFGRAAYYFSTTIGTMLLPAAVSQKHGTGGDMKILNKALVLMLAFSAACFIPVNFWKGALIGMLYGDAYSGAQAYVKYVSIISTALSVCTVLSNYAAGTGKSGRAAAVLAAADLLIIVYAVLGRGIEGILTFIGAAGAAGAAAVYASILYEFRKKRQADYKINGRKD